MIYLLIVVMGGVMSWCVVGVFVGQVQLEILYFIIVDMVDMFEQQFVIGVQVIILCGGYFFQYVWMVVNCFLIEDYYVVG